MRTLLLLGLFVMTASLGAAPLPTTKEAAVPAGPAIHVLLEKNVPSVFLEVKGAFNVIRKDSGAIVSRGRVGKRFMMHAIPDGLRWGEELPDVYQVAIMPAHPDTVVYVNGMQYKGSISVYRVRDNRITVVNDVPIEAYIKATLAIRHTESLTQEALSALAIVARTEAYEQVLAGRTKSRPWEVVATDVGYYGYGVSQPGNSIEAAVDATRFMVLHSAQARSIPLQADPMRAEELAKSGHNAKKILQALFPKQRLALTIDPEEVAIR